MSVVTKSPGTASPVSENSAVSTFQSSASGALLKVAVEWNVIDHVPYTIRLLRFQRPEATFHDFDELRPAGRCGTRRRCAVIATCAERGC